MSQNNKQQSIWRKFASLFINFPEENEETAPVDSKNRPAQRKVAPPARAGKNSEPASETGHEPKDAFKRPEADFPFPGKKAKPQVSAKVAPEKTDNVSKIRDLDDDRKKEANDDDEEMLHTAKQEFKEEARELDQCFTSPAGLIHCPPIAEKPEYAPIVSFKNVTKIFNKGTPNEFCAIENVSFEIEDLPDVGEFIALVGPSGCGKSTVLNLIQGFQEVGPPTLGQILVRNRPVKGPGRDRGMIFQKYSSFPHLTVLENVKFGLELNREALGFSDKTMTNLAMEMIKKVGLAGHEDKYPYQLSGGQQQRVAIARTLVLKPRIIFMDEPFSALDEPTRIEMQQLITDLWHEVEATVFIITHSLAEALYLSDRIFMFTPSPGRLNKQIMIPPEAIGKLPGLSPLEVQESPKFKQALKELTDEFLKIGEIN
jgi:ABC-type nitrate/sulfonate/bicarbonate transport system ATPase subunit